MRKNIKLKNRLIENLKEITIFKELKQNYIKQKLYFSI